MNLLAVAAGACLIAIAAGLVRSSSSPRQPRRQPLLPHDDAYNLSQTDPVEALNRYGTPENYEQLLDQGVDLRGLGYEPPADR